MKRLLTFSLLVIAACWLAYFTLGHWAAEVIARRAGAAIIKLGQGKIFSPSEFTIHRLFEICWLATVLAVLLVPAGMILRLCPSSRASFRWVWPTVTLFCYLNIAVWFAGHTVIFWGSMWQGEQSQNLTRFYIKLLLAQENTAPLKIALMGNSQTRAQIDEDILNSKLGPTIITTELHYPGSKGYDLYLLQPTIDRAHPRWVICYVTEAYFSGGSRYRSTTEFLHRSRRSRFIEAQRTSFRSMGKYF